MNTPRGTRPDGALRRMKPLLAFLILIAGCAPAAERVTVQPGVAVAPDQQLALWQGAQVDTLHGVQVSDSILSGIPAWQPSACDSCRIALPLATVDSVFALPKGRNGLTAAAAAVGAAAMAGIWMWSD